LAEPDVFLSYYREDADVAKLFADAFAIEGMGVWWDVTLRYGETYDEFINGQVLVIDGGGSAIKFLSQGELAAVPIMHDPAENAA